MNDNPKKKPSSKDIIFFDPPLRSDPQLSQYLFDDSLRGQEIPKGCHSIATYLQARGIEAAVIPIDVYLKNKHYATEKKDAFATELKKVLNEKIREHNPQIVAFSLMYTFTEPVVYDMIEFVRANYPDKLIIVGGNHATFSSDLVLDWGERSWVDAVIRGEGEWTTGELIKQLKIGGDISKIEGISFVNKEGKIQNNPKRTHGILTSLPTIDYDLIDLPFGHNIADFNHTVAFSRGCTGKCAFCTSPRMWGNQIRHSNPECFEIETRFLLDSGATIIDILDDDIMANESLFSVVMKILSNAKEEYPRAKFLAQTRVDNLLDVETTKGHVKLMKKAGIKKLFLGIESGSQIVLDSMKKGTKTESVKKACLNVRQYAEGDIQIGSFWLFGHPGATLETEEESLQFMKELLDERLIDDIEPNIIIPFPGANVASDPRLKIFDFNKKHYSIVRHKPVHELVDPSSGKIILSAEQIESILSKAFELRRQYLNVPITYPNRPIE